MTHSFARYSGWLWFAAFVCALFPVNAWQLEFFGAAILLLFAWAYLFLSKTMREGWNVPRTGVIIFAGLFWLLALASVFWSEAKTVSLIGFCFFTALPLTFFVGVMAGKEAFFKMIAYALGAVFALLSIWSVVQFFFLNAYFGGQARHPLADPSSLGALFSLALFCSLGWILAAQDKTARIWAILLSTLLLCGILSTVARGPVFAFLPGIILFCILLWPQVKAQKKALFIVLLGGLACYGAMQTGIEKRMDMGERIFGTVTMQMEDITNSRTKIWASSVDMIKDRPWLGTGIGTFFLYFPEYRRTNHADGAYMAHNDPLQFWVEMGVLGSFLFYAFVISAGLRSFDALKVLKEGRTQERIVVVSIFSALAAMVVQSHVSFNLYNLSILMVTGFLLAVWFHVTGRAVAEPPRMLAMPEKSVGLNKVAFALLFAITAWLLCSLLAGEYFVNRARGNLFQEKMFDFADDINAANSVSQGLNYRAFLLAVNVPMSILDFEKDRLKDEQKKELYEQVKGDMDAVISLNPRMSEAYYYLGRVQTMVPSSIIPEGTPSAEEYYKKALHIEPINLGARMELFRLVKERGGSIEEQLAVLEPGFYFVYTVPAAEAYYTALSQVYLQSGNYGKTNATLAKLLDFKKRSDFSKTRQNTSLPQAIMGGDGIFEQRP